MIETSHRPSLHRHDAHSTQTHTLTYVVSAEQMLEVQILLETAPLQLLSLHHTGLSNASLSLLCSLLTANSEQCATAACLTVLKLGPPVEWATDSTGQQLSKVVLFHSDTVQQLSALAGGLPELQLLQIWGLDEQQQLSVADSWTDAKGNFTMQTTADFLRLGSNRSVHCWLCCAVLWSHLSQLLDSG